MSVVRLMNRSKDYLKGYSKEKRMSRLSEAEAFIKANMSVLESLEGLSMDELNKTLAAISADIQAEMLKLLAVIADRMEGKEGE